MEYFDEDRQVRPSDPRQAQAMIDTPRFIQQAADLRSTEGTSLGDYVDEECKDEEIADEITEDGTS